MVEGVCSGANLPGAKSWLTTFLAVSPWAVHFILHYLSLLICKIELTIIVPTTRLNRWLWVKSLEKCLIHRKCSVEVVILVLSWSGEEHRLLLGSLWLWFSCLIHCWLAPGLSSDLAATSFCWVIAFTLPDAMSGCCLGAAAVNTLPRDSRQTACIFQRMCFTWIQSGPAG